MKIKKSGQTLIEVMVALFILTAGLLGILDLLAQSLAINKTTANQTTAVYLASEGIEIAKNLIDHDVYAQIAQVPGDTGWGTCFGTNGGDYELDYTTVDCTAMRKYNDSDPDFLYYNASTHLYLYSYDDITGEATPTIFTRLIRVTPDSNATIPEITVQSIVTWPSGLSSQSVELEDHFYNWLPT